MACFQETSFLNNIVHNRFFVFCSRNTFSLHTPISNDLGQKRLVSSDNYFQTKMKAVVQRVLSGSVRVEGEVVASIGKGFVALIGIHRFTSLIFCGYFV